MVVWFRSLGLVVRGALQARGTAEHPVIFGGLKARGWKGVFIEGGEGENLLRRCRISGAEFGIRSSRARLVVEDCRFQENTWGVVGEDGQVDISGSLVRASVKTGIAARNSRLAVKGSVITENAAGGFLLEGSPVDHRRQQHRQQRRLGHQDGRPPTEVFAGNNWWGTVAPISRKWSGALSRRIRCCRRRSAPVSPPTL